FGQGPLMPGATLPLDKRHYAFAPDGETTARSLIKNAILHAKKFIYLEDQYFVNWEATQALVHALNNGIKHLTIVVPHHAIGDLPGMVGHRRRCIKALRDAGGPRVRVFYKCGPGEKPGDYNTYVHSKVTIVDDEFAIVGSVNYNRRSWEHDSEICVGLYDPSSDQVLSLRFAHWLRMRLWAQHIFGVVVPPSAPEASDTQPWDDVYAELLDGVAAGVHWQELIMLEQAHADEGADYDQAKYNPIATVRPYETMRHDDPQEIELLPVPIFGTLIEALAGDAIWDTFLDPGRHT
ncbi:MAG TPA: phospholipase D-like domain-containing protein, partial [Polyangiaceae bacterium]|nr:phospholipase D-like domain-containing protein [Polyangiaceae bacterium]